MSKAETPVTITRLEGEERASALALVEQLQEGRASRRLRSEDVPHVLLSYQAAWHEDRAQVRIAEKSRRIGYSWGALAAEAALEAASATGMDQFYMGYNMRMAAEFIGDVAYFARFFGEVVSSIDVWRETEVVGDERRDITVYMVRFASGFKVEALSSNPHNWRSRQGHAIVDEAAFHKNLAEVIKGALAFKMWGGRVSIVSTHNGEDNPFAEYVREVRAGKLPWSLHRITFDDALRAGFYRRVCLVRGLDWSPEAEAKYRAEIYADYPSPDDAAEELDCIPKRGSGSYFSRLLIEHCQDASIPILRLTKPAEFVLDPGRLKATEEWIRDVLRPVLDSLPKLRSVFGQDFGRDGDLSHQTILQEEHPGRWREAFLLELRRIPFDVQKMITLAVLDGLPLFHHAKFDARGNGQSHAEAALQVYGPSRVECVMLSAPWYAENFPRYRQAYEDRSIVVAKSEDLIADHRSVVLVNGQPKMSDARIKGSDGEYRHGDSAVSGVLAWAATRCEADPGLEVHTACPRSSRAMLRGYR